MPSFYETIPSYWVQNPNVPIRQPIAQNARASVGQAMPPANDPSPMTPPISGTTGNKNNLLLGLLGITGLVAVVAAIVINNNKQSEKPTDTVNKAKNKAHELVDKTANLAEETKVKARKKSKSFKQLIQTKIDQFNAWWKRNRIRSSETEDGGGNHWFDNGTGDSGSYDSGGGDSSGGGD
jgi:hypothetical protein